MKKADKLFLAVVAVIFLAASFLFFHYRPSGGGYIRITVDGTLYGEYSLNEDQTISINQTNICQIQNQKVRMIEADCPDHLCMKQKPVGKDGGSIICLPNKVVIELVSQGEKSPDQLDDVA